jgi:predicted nucleic acid-binding Zn ribbon protein
LLQGEVDAAYAEFVMKPAPGQIIHRKRRASMLVPETSGSLMGPLLARLGGTGRALEFRVFESYQATVGEMLRTRTAPERLLGTTLLVRVESSALGHELSMLKGEILDKMTAALGPSVVTDIRTRVRPLAAP